METPLKLSIQGLEYSESLEKRIRDKVEHLENSCSRIEGCRVLVEFQRKQSPKGKPYIVQIEVNVPGQKILVKKERDEDVYVALRDAFEAVQQEVETWSGKERGSGKKRASPIWGQVVRIVPEKGLGLIKATNGREISFTREQCLHNDFDTLKVGDALEFQVIESGEGPHARKVTRRTTHGE